MVTVLVLKVVHRYKKVFVYQYSTYKEAIAKFSLQPANLAGYKALQKEPTEATLRIFCLTLLIYYLSSTIQHSIKYCAHAQQRELFTHIMGLHNISCCFCL